MLQCLNVKIKEGGFTLIEMLVAIMVFLLTMGAISGLFISAIHQQRAAFAAQALLDQTSYALEYMSRAFRMAKKELSAPACLPVNGSNYEITRQGAGLKFINHLQGDDCQEFFIQDARLKYRRGIGQGNESILDLTSNKLEVISLKFNLSGESQDDDLQSKVTIFMEVKGKGQIEQSQRIRIQTTISQRDLDVLR